MSTWSPSCQITSSDKSVSVLPITGGGYNLVVATAPPGATGVTQIQLNSEAQPSVLPNGSGVVGFKDGPGIHLSSDALFDMTVTNTGVTSAVAGTGIGVSSATGAVTLSNTGVTSIVAGAGIGASSATGAVTLTSTGMTGLAANGTAVTPLNGSINIASSTGISITTLGGSSMLITNTLPGMTNVFRVLNDTLVSYQSSGGTAATAVSALTPLTTVGNTASVNPVSKLWFLFPAGTVGKYYTGVFQITFNACARGNSGGTPLTPITLYVGQANTTTQTSIANSITEQWPYLLLPNVSLPTVSYAGYMNCEASPSGNTCLTIGVQTAQQGVGPTTYDATMTYGFGGTLTNISGIILYESSTVPPT